MSPEQLCERIASDLDLLTLAFLRDSRRAAAYKALELAIELHGDEKYSEESLLDIAGEMTAAAEGGVQ